MNRKRVLPNYKAFLNMFNIVEVEMNRCEKCQSGVYTIHGVDSQLLIELRRRKFNANRKQEGYVAGTLLDKIDHISIFAKKEIFNYFSKNPEHPRIYNELTSKLEDGKATVERKDRAEYLYKISEGVRLYEVDYQASIPQYLARQAGCSLILESIKNGNFYPQENRDEMKETILKVIGSRFSDELPELYVYERLTWLAKWLTDRFSELEARKFIGKLIDIQSIHELYTCEEHQRNFCRKHPIGTANLHDGVIFAGWNEADIRQLTDELDSEKCESGMGILYSVKEITPGHECDLTAEWTKNN